MTDNKKMNEQARKIVERNLPNLKASSIFLSLYSEDMLKDPVPVIQLGMAMLLDKPIYLLVPKGQQIPMNIMKVAMDFEHYDPADTESLREASVRILKNAGIDTK